MITLNVQSLSHILDKGELDKREEDEEEARAQIHIHRFDIRNSRHDSVVRVDEESERENHANHILKSPF